MLLINNIHNIEARKGIGLLPDKSVHTCVTSPPYWGVRDFKHKQQVGMERSPTAYLNKLVKIFGEVHRVLRPDGTLFLNMGDSYSAHNEHGYKRKDMFGMPWRLAFALQDEGWYLRQDIIWSKPTPMPDSAGDRCTRSHEYIFLLSKSPRYYFDQDALKEKASEKSHARHAKHPAGWDNGAGSHNGLNGHYKPTPKTAKPGGLVKSNSSFYQATADQLLYRNKRSVWNIASTPAKSDHTAAFPEELAYYCVMAGCPPDGLVLDPFIGTGTTGLVCRKNNRNFIGFEINHDTVLDARRILDRELGLFQ